MGRVSQDFASWEMYFAARSRISKSGKNAQESGAYLPSPREIQDRIDMNNELKDLEFSTALITSIMLYDTPTIERVRQMVARYGQEEAAARCKPFIYPDQGD